MCKANCLLEERVGFEPTDQLRPLVFKTNTLSHLGHLSIIEITITMTYEDAQALVVLLKYELYHAEIADIRVEIPVEMSSRCVNTCQHKIWVNPKNNPFADDSSV